MSSVLWAVALVGGVSAVFALWRTVKLSRDVERLKRSEYYTHHTLKGIPRHVSDTIEPLRVQLATLASGAPVAEELIRNGRLYWDVSAADAQKMIDFATPATADKFLVVDVRTPKEYVLKHVPQAKLIPIEELEMRYKTEISSTVEKVFVYCTSGDRSRLACDFLSRQGYGNLYNIHDGLQRWDGPTAGQEPLNLIQIQSKSPGN